jgi:hypothetical protein
LVPCASAGAGVGDETFDLWDSPESITLRLIREPEGEEPELWGPVVDLDPAFSEKEAFLLGVSDFFAAFSVEFDRGGDPPKFWLNY